jgi:hypothetical protein
LAKNVPKYGALQKTVAWYMQLNFSRNVGETELSLLSNLVNADAFEYCTNWSVKVAKLNSAVLGG